MTRQDGPPPFPGRRRRERHWEEDYLGKNPDQSWSDYLGVGGFSGDRDGSGMEEGPQGHRRRRHRDDRPRSPNPHRLYRNTREGKLAGVCAGIADFLNIDAWIVRLALVLAMIPFQAVAIGYIVLWIVLKERPPHLYESEEEEVFWRSVTTKPDQTLAGLRSKFRTLDRTLGEMESFVASREFDLHRQFRDLEKK